MNRSALTLKFYTWEEKFIPRGRSVTEPQAQRLARRVWRWARTLPQYRRRARVCRPPEVRFGPGSEGHSYCYGRELIVLAPYQRTEKILIHELTHALGPETHGLRFQALYLQLILKFVVRA